MAKRSQMYQKLPWNGGVNDSVDPGVLNDNDLVTADNVVFATSGSRLKREGLSYLDTTIPAPDLREITSNVVTLTWSDTGLQSPDELISDGEYLTFVCADDSAYNATAAKVTVVHGGSTSTVSYTVSATADQAQEAAGTFTITRAEDVLSLTDYWRTDSSNVQQQRLVSHTSRGNMFYYDNSNNREHIPCQPEISTITCVAKASLVDDDYFTIYTANDGTQYDFYYQVTGSATGSGLTNAQEIDIQSDTTADEVATRTQGVINALAGFSASVSTNTVTVTNAEGGITTDITENVANSGFTVAVTTQGATCPTSEIDQIRSIVFNNKLIHTYTGAGNLPTKYRPEDSANFQKLLNAPDAAFMTNYLSRLWCNDKTDPHRLHYSTTANEEEWNGTGDSGAIDIYPGDGDPIGITAIYTYKGALFVAKKTKIYRILGDSPENFQVVPISGNLGSEGSMVVNIEQDDAIFVSKRGFHSAQATEQFGDVSSKFLSAKIQNTFNTWSQTNLDNIQGVWLPELNSVFFGVPASGALNSELWALNTELGAWYRWPSISCQAVSSRLSGNVSKLVFGTSDGRVIQAQNGTYTDFGTSPYVYRVKTGRIYPGGNPHSVKAFKRIGFIYKPLGDFTFTVKLKIDNHTVQSYSFSQESPTDKLGVDFVLGSSELGVTGVLNPYFTTIEGYGRGITIEIEQAADNEQVEIYGYIVEYEEEGFRQEVITGD